MQHEIRRVSNQVLAWLDDPSSVPSDQPHCSYCNSPKVERNTRCEICRQYGAITGPRKNGHSNVFVENFTRRFVKRNKQ